MLAAAARVFVRMGAEVWVSANGDNLVRTVAQSRGGERPDDAAVAQVHAQGLPNLLHELVHAVLAGKVDDDHGIDYSGIPFDLGRPDGRRMLWEELSCSTISCAYLRGDLQRAGIAPSRIAVTVDAWFSEQVEIQPVFYGAADDLAGFIERVDAALREHAAEAEAVVGDAYRFTREALASAGAGPSLAIPPVVESLTAIWRRVMTGSARGGGSA